MVPTRLFLGAKDALVDDARLMLAREEQTCLLFRVTQRLARARIVKIILHTYL